MHVARTFSFASISILAALALAACGDDGNGNGNGDGGPPPLDACAGLGCQQVTCMGGGTTSISGTVYAPNGTLPLYNATVYVPNSPVGALTEGVQCDRCGATLSGDPLIETVTDTEGKFTLENMPVGRDIPVVIQIGKWRRQFVIPQIDMCVDQPLTATTTRLPKNQDEGDIPQMALATGGADALECMLRKIGLDDAEFTAAGGRGKVHLFTGTGGTPRFAPGLNGGAAFTNATSLWDTVDHLRPYDVVFLSCEGGQNPDTKPAPSLQALYDYSGIGGRVFMSHWHNYWVQAGPGLLPNTATFNFQADIGDVTADVNTSFTGGADMAQWLQNVNASTMLGKIPLTDAHRRGGRHAGRALDQRPVAELDPVLPVHDAARGRADRALRQGRRLGHPRVDRRRLGRQLAVPERLRHRRPVAAGEGAGVHDLRHRVVRRPPDRQAGRQRPMIWIVR